VIYIRDLRNVLISWAYFCKSVVSYVIYKKEFSKFLEPELEYNISHLNNNDLVEYFIRNYYSGFVDWIKSWDKYSQNKKNNLIMKYEDYKNNPKKYFETILNFKEFNLNLLTSHKFNKKIHVLKSETSPEADYRNIMTKEQILYVDNIGKNVIHKFYSLTNE